MYKFNDSFIRFAGNCSPLGQPAPRLYQKIAGCRETHHDARSAKDKRGGICPTCMFNAGALACPEKGNYPVGERPAEANRLRPRSLGRPPFGQLRDRPQLHPNHTHCRGLTPSGASRSKVLLQRCQDPRHRNATSSDHQRPDAASMELRDKFFLEKGSDCCAAPKHGARPKLPFPYGWRKAGIGGTCRSRRRAISNAENGQ
jgi:hypothetical protein